MSEYAEAAKQVSRWASIGLAVSALGFAGFYLALFLRDNAPMPVELKGIAHAPAGQFFYQVQACELKQGALQVRGWAVRKGRSWPLTDSQVILALADGRTLGLDTALLEQPKLAALIHAQTQDQVVYYAPGFAASINADVAGIDLRGAQLWLRWEDAQSRALLPLACPALHR